jgi:hypothetical protein
MARRHTNQRRRKRRCLALPVSAVNRRRTSGTLTGIRPGLGPLIPRFQSGGSHAHDDQASMREQTVGNEAMPGVTGPHFALVRTDLAFRLREACFGLPAYAAHAEQLRRRGVLNTAGQE